MNYADLTASQRDALTAVVALDTLPDEPTARRVHRFYEERFGPVSYDGLTGNVLASLLDRSLSRKERSESDGRVWVYRPTPEGHEVVHQTLRERARWITPPEPRPDHDAQATLAEVLAR